MEVNMVFVIPKEFCAPEKEAVALALGAGRAMFEKPVEAGKHMHPLFIKGHIDGNPLGHMMIDQGASINIMLLHIFEKLRHGDSDLRRTNLCLSGFAGEPAEAWGLVSKELTVGSKMVPTVFFMVDVWGQYNVLLGRD
jgi:hypothetical protein